MGSQTILGSDVSNDANVMVAESVTLSQTATIQSLSLYVTQAAGSVVLAIFDNYPPWSGSTGAPGSLIAQTSSFTPVVGWNTQLVVTPAVLAPGTYWLTLLPSDNNLHFPMVLGTSQGFATANQTFGPMPTYYPTLTSQSTSTWPIYATVIPGTPTPTEISVSNPNPLPTGTGGLASPTNTARPLGSTAAANGYWEYLPIGYGGSVRKPLMIFLHGSDGDATTNPPNLNAVSASNGPLMLISTGQWPTNRPFVVLSPQHVFDNDCMSPTEIYDFIQYAINNYQVDPKRVYLTGLSCGAMGGAYYQSIFGFQQVTASVFVSGDASWAWNSFGCSFPNGGAIWSFHGDADSVVPISGDKMAYANFATCPQPHNPAQYTVIPGGGHNIWFGIYDLTSGYDIYSWMLGFSKP